LLESYLNGPKTTYQQERSALSGQINVETMVYVDNGVVSARGGSTATVNYVLSIMNIVSQILLLN